MVGPGSICGDDRTAFLAKVVAGPFATEAEALAACPEEPEPAPETGVAQGCCPDDPVVETLYLSGGAAVALEALAAAWVPELVAPARKAAPRKAAAGKAKPIKKSS